jgi:hypothetical protein
VHAEGRGCLGSDSHLLAQQLLHITEAQTTLADRPGRSFHGSGTIERVRLSVAPGRPEGKTLAINHVPGVRWYGGTTGARRSVLAECDFSSTAHITSSLLLFYLGHAYKEDEAHQNERYV